MRSRIASASVGSSSHSCQPFTGSWLVIIVAFVPTRSSSSSSRSLRSSAVMGRSCEVVEQQQVHARQCPKPAREAAVAVGDAQLLQQPRGRAYSTVKPLRAA
jgi:hypothetical protein